VPLGWAGGGRARGWCAGVVAVVVGGMPLVVAAHAPAAVRYRVTRTIPVGAGPVRGWRWIPLPAPSTWPTPAMATAIGDSTVSVIDATTGAVTGTIPVGHQPDGVAVDPAAGTVYVAN
jgi:YVTN family beta-propeller protein